MMENRDADRDLEILREKLEEVLRTEGGTGDASHDSFHAARVYAACRCIAAEEGGCSPRILLAASYLHDLVNLPKNHPDRSRASRLSAERSRPILKELGYSGEETDAVCHAIEAHSFSAEIEPRTLEARILQDADRIEALGAIGIARVFYTAALIGAELFDGADPLAQKRPLNDKSFALDHFETKLFRLPEGMWTRTGRRLAEARVAYMRGFVSQLAEEAEF